MIVPRAVVVGWLRLTGARRTFATADNALRRVCQRALRPQTYGPPRGLRADVSVAVSRDPWPTYTVTPRAGAATGSVVYLHGGSWVSQIVAEHWHLVAQIAAEARTAVVIPLYPLIPFGTADAVNEVVVDLVRRLERSGPVAIAGDSAGGQIALAAALTLRDRFGTLLAQTMLIAPAPAPALDLTMTNPRIAVVQPSDPWLATPGLHELVRLWRGERDLRDPVVSPLEGDLTGLGPITVFSDRRTVRGSDASSSSRRRPAHALRCRDVPLGIPDCTAQRL